MTTLKRAVAFPALPTLDESGLPGYVATAIWYSIAVPKGTPPAVKKIYRGIVDALATPGMKNVLAGMSADPGVCRLPSSTAMCALEVQR